MTQHEAMNFLKARMSEHFGLSGQLFLWLASKEPLGTVPASLLAKVDAHDLVMASAYLSGASSMFKEMGHYRSLEPADYLGRRLLALASLLRKMDLHMA